MTKRLVASYLAVTVFVLVVLEIPLGFSFAQGERAQLIADVKTDALVMATLVEDDLESGKPPAAAKRARDYAKRSGGRIVVVKTNGTSVLDTGDASGRSFASRPEIASALAGRISEGLRHSRTLGYDLVFVAVPVASAGTVYGAVRITYPASALSSRIRRNWIGLAMVAAVVLLVVLLLGIALARGVTRPIRALEAAADDIARGDLAARAPAAHGPPELASLVAAFNEMASRLQELVGSQRAFVADASHQLRTPLTALRLRLENLEDVLESEGRSPDDVEAALRETQRLSRIVDGLLALARAEGTRPERGEIDVAAIVLDRLANWEPFAAEHGVALRAEAEGALGALAVPGHLEQMLDNLIANAIDVSERHTTITVAARRADGWIEVHVIDEGPGMPTDQRERAFDRFWGGSSGGSGLGLAIVRQLATTSGGGAELAEAPGGGLDAIVRLPAAA